MYLIGLTGGIASGKTTVARRLVEHGAIHVNADELARRAVAPGTKALAGIVSEFGAEVLDSEGALDRAKVGEIVFGDDDQRDRLNAIVHPAVRELAAEEFARIEREHPSAVVVYDVPLLVEAAVDHPFDLIVVTNAPRRSQISRLVNVRGLAPVQAEARVDAQVDNARRLEIADVIIDTDGTLGHTMSQADALWSRVRDERAGQSSALS